MKKLLVLLIACIPMVGQADVNKDLTRCSAIESDSERLDCYDTVSAYYQAKSNKISTPPAAKQADVKIRNQQKKISTAEDTFGKTE
ncbi:MAG: hypothetical protein OQK04_07925, partial [Kangiellaceae bacterium]|nr:hypothetical protein [Kangiellaceae bacterium]